MCHPHWREQPPVPPSAIEAGPGSTYGPGTGAVTRAPRNADVQCMDRIIALRKLVGKYNREGPYQKRNTAQWSLDEACTELNHLHRGM